MISSTSKGWTIEEKQKVGNYYSITICYLVLLNIHKEKLMELLHFKPLEETEDINKDLSHLSISIHPTGIRVKEERGLDEYMKTFNNKEEVLEYLKGIL